MYLQLIIYKEFQSNCYDLVIVIRNSSLKELLQFCIIAHPKLQLRVKQTAHLVNKHYENEVTLNEYNLYQKSC